MGLWLMIAGPFSTASFFSVTVPDTGLKKSPTAFTDSRAPHS